MAKKPRGNQAPTDKPNDAALAPTAILPSAKSSQPVSSANPTDSVPNAGTVDLAADADEDIPLSLVQYLIMNGLFYAVCILILLVVRLTLHETRGLWYFFALIMASFTIVSIYDFAYDRLSRRGESKA